MSEYIPKFKNKKHVKQILIAMMYASDLSPQFEDNYYQNLNASNISRFLNGICEYFDVTNDNWIMHFCNIQYMDNPSETIRFLINNLCTDV